MGYRRGCLSASCVSCAVSVCRVAILGRYYWLVSPSEAPGLCDPCTSRRAGEASCTSRTGINASSRIFEKLNGFVHFDLIFEKVASNLVFLGNREPIFLCARVMDIGRCDAARVAPARTLFDLLDSDLLDAVFAFVCENSRFAVALVCRAFRARHPAGAVFRTDVIAMSYTPSVFAWAACLPVPCPPLKCVADLLDSSKIFDAFVSLGRLPLVVLAQHAGAVVHKLGDADEDVRYMALVTLGELGSGALVQHGGVVKAR